MLIVPVVEGLNWRRPPPVTIGLILLNCLVFLLYQGGDDERQQKALEAYFASSLPAIELPLYAVHLRDTNARIVKRLEKADPNWDAPERVTQGRLAQFLVNTMANDEAFMKRLRAGGVVPEKDPRFAKWREDRTKFEALEGRVSYRRFGFTPADPRPVTWITSMFLHGDLMHLLGNMVFLFIVGVAVESALGGGWYLALYLLGGLAGDLLFFLVHSGSTVPSVGASGAISGLMGLFTVVFGAKQVNFFYWLFVIFGFKTMRGIVVLPIWIAYEVLQFFVDRDGSTGYMAHAGGLAGGAVLGLVARRYTGKRVEAFHEKRDQEKFDQAEFDRARALVAKVDFKGASVVFRRLAHRFPERADLMRQWHAVAKFEPASEGYHQSVGYVLSLPNPDGPARQFQRQVFLEYLDKAKPVPRLDADTLGRIAMVMARSGHLAEAERAAEMLLKIAPGDEQLPAIWDHLANGHAAVDTSPVSLKKAKHYRAMIAAQAKASRA
ncbi:hypothetical protein BWI17_08970 [Betaproteobacteria bacterium GR16-43]|nr:hypothetical protein BWI17_08970 [Betaproteobacteria bacterium GR16-43]